MFKNEHKLIGALVAALVLAGCGSTPTAPKAKRPIAGAKLQDGMSQPGYGQVPGMPMPGQMGPGGGNAEGAQLLQGARATIAQVSGFDAQIKSYTEGHYKQGEKVSELRKATTEARLIWVKPLKIRAEVIQTSNPLLVGAAMATTDGQNVTARAKGLLGLIPFKMTVQDPKLGNNRNHKFTENNPKTQIERMTAPTAVWTVIGEQVVEGVPCKMVQIDNVKRLDKEITKEIVAVDPQMMALRKVLMFTGAMGEKKVVDHTFIKFKWNPKVSSESFNL